METLITSLDHVGTSCSINPSDALPIGMDV